jgi:osmotically-inducible protein OsmY
MAGAALLVGGTASCRKTDQAGSEAARGAETAVDRAGQNAADAWTTTKVQSKYFADGTVKGRNIDVSTEGAW